MKYRPDIDGLRAVAVLGVIFFHLDLLSAKGGFLGVDVFFVISGYLITSVITQSQELGTFTIKGFYERRARRILPALLAVLSVSFVVAQAFFDGNDLKNFGESLYATAVFASNIYFWSESGYFAGPSELKPLLHTWSLAVEEQFYLIFPILFVLFSTHKRLLITLLLALAVASYGGAAYYSNVAPEAAFYLFPNRAWELLIGAIVALDVIPNTNRTLLANVTGAGGLGLIVYSFFAFDSSGQLPAPLGLVPTIGAAMFIYAGREVRPLANALLSQSSIVFIGLISYSLYLWHWPLIAFFRHVNVVEPSTIEKLVLFAITLVLASISWRFVEGPFRKKGFLSQRAVLIAATGTLCAVFFSGLFVTTLPSLAGQQVLASDHAVEERPPKYVRECTGLRKRGYCSFGADKGDARKTIFVWGDSHAGALLPGFRKLAESAEAVRVEFASENGCLPLLGVGRKGRNCERFNRRVLQYLKEAGHVHQVVLVGRWALWATGERYRGESGGNVAIYDGLTNGTDRDQNKKVFRRGVERTLSRISNLGPAVVIVGQVPEIGYDVPKYLERRGKTGSQPDIRPTLEEYMRRQDSYIGDMLRLADAYHANVVNVQELLCEVGRCQIAINGNPLYRDDDHVSEHGAGYIVGALKDVFIDDR